MPVVISKIFKDQVGKQEMSFSVLLWFKPGNTLSFLRIYKVVKLKVETEYIYRTASFKCCFSCRAMTSQ